jgi:hypothetical protein
VPRRLVEQLQQVQPEPAVPENRAHINSPARLFPLSEHDVGCSPSR